MSWFDDQGIAGYSGAYEQGGITGGQSGGVVPDQATAPAFNAAQQVGHDGTINGMTREQYRDAWQGSGVTNAAGMDQWLAAHGGQRLDASGNVTTPFGETLDMGKAFKTGNGSAAWGGVGGASSPTGNIAPGANGLGASGALSAAMSVPGAGGSGGGDYAPKSFDPLKYEAFDPKSFNYQDDPGVAVRLARGEQAMQNSAAAKGTLLTGAFARALTDYGQESGSQEYGNAFGRAFGVNQANNAGRAGAFNANTGADLGYGNLALGNKNSNNQYSLGMGNLALGYHSADQNYNLGMTNANNSYALGQGNLGLGWANYGLNADGQNFNQGYSLANMGQNSAVQQGNFGSAFANNAGGYATGAGNAQGAAAINSGNGYANALQTGANNAIGAYYANQAKPRGYGMSA